MNRRDFLAALPCAAALAFRGEETPPSILVHEHILVDFAGADQIRPGRYDPAEVFRVALPKLQELKAFGCRRFLECTPQFIGRDPALLRRLEQAVGLEIWTNTGIYGAANHKYVPAFARKASAEALAERFIAEVRNGVAGVVPRFIKTGVNQAPLNPLDRKLVRAAALTSRETGLTVASHTADGRGALEQVEILAATGVPPERFVWVHAQNEKDHAFHETAARAGAWVEFDGIAEDSIDWHLECVRFMAERDLLDRTLVSQDAGWYHVGEPGGGNFRGYTLIYTQFLPRIEPLLRRTLMWDNPRRAFPESSSETQRHA
ncbi:MAG: aryldialkylphosphatase [Acidobacteriota bacterium]